MLGFVKYFWRDAVSIHVGKDKAKQELLETCLSSFDVSGLGISHLSGHTLVRYAGSLVGRDFRAIAQAAPFVLYDLVPNQCYETWVSLSNLIPLVWQPEIEDVDVHLVRFISRIRFLSYLKLFLMQELLEAAVQEFLARTAKWTPQWFNKPKFHILLHLTEHIRRFGPAALFATEAFESFNAVIRAKSIHSNRHSPSRDIARAFSHGNHIRHILSGAHILLCKSELPSTIGVPPTQRTYSSFPSSSLRSDPEVVNAQEAGLWWNIGPSLLGLVSQPNIVADYLGLDSPEKAKLGMYH